MCFSLGKKLGLAFGTILILFAIIAIFSYDELRFAEDRFNFVTKNQLDSLLNGVKTQQSGTNASISMRNYRYTEAEDDLKKVKASLERFKSSIDETDKLMKKYPQTSIGEFYTDILKNYADFKEQSEEIFKLSQMKKELEYSLIEAQDLFKISVDDFRKWFITFSIRAIDENINVIARRRVGVDIPEINALIEQMGDIRLAVMSATNSNSQSALELVAEKVELIPQMIQKLEQLAVNPEIKPQIALIKDNRDKWKYALIKYIDIRKQLASDYEKIVNTENEIDNILKLYSAKVTQNISDVAVSSSENLKITSYTIIIITTISFIIGILVSIIASRSITAPIKRVVAISKRIGDGDFTISRDEYGYKGTDEIASLIDAFDSMVRTISGIIEKILKTAEDVNNEADKLVAISEESSASVHEISESVQKINKLSESNTDSLEKSNSEIEEISAGATVIASSATNLSNDAKSANGLNQNAIEAVRKIIYVMDSVNEISKANEEGIKKLVDDIEHITGFVGVISSIADQTNLLALNATIEAARAGDAGRGFAVVADQVRKLAEESGHSAKNISEQIISLKNSASEAINGSKKSGDAVKGVISIVDEADKVIGKCVELVNMMCGNIDNIAGTTHEQATSTKQIADSVADAAEGNLSIREKIENVKLTSEQTAQVTKGVAYTAENLSILSSTVNELLSQFRI